MRELKPREPRPINPQFVVQARPGFGKSSLVASAPAPLILMSRGETGYDTLLASGLVPAVPAIEIERWGDLILLLVQLTSDPQGRQTLALDTAEGFERLCHEYVCQRDFANDWSERGFAAYQKGYDLAVTEWIGMLNRLDRLHGMGITIVLLCHSRVATFKNPLGADFDRYIADMHAKTWAATAKWADAVFFGTFHTIIEDERKAKRSGKGKAIGGIDRVLHTEHRDAYDAKNRFGMEPELWLDGGPSAAWSTLWTAITKGKDG